MARALSSPVVGTLCLSLSLFFSPKRTGHDRPQAVRLKLRPCPGRPLAVKLKGVDRPARPDGAGEGVREGSRPRAALEDGGPGGQVEPRAHGRDVGGIQDVGAVGQGPRPQFGGGGQQVDPAGAGGGGGSNLNTFTAGAGGVGGSGYVLVVEYF